MTSRFSVLISSLVVVSSAAAAPVPQDSLERGPARLDERVIQLDGRSERLELWKERDGGALVPHYRISLDGQTWSRPRATSYVLRLKRGDFDPLVAIPEPAAASLAGGGDLYVVQYHTQPLEAFGEAIEELGGEVHRFLADHAHIAYLPEGAAETVGTLPFVRWVGAYRAEYRLDPELLPALVSGTLEARQGYVIQVMERGSAMKAVVAERIAALGGTIDAQIPDGFMLEATLTPTQLRAVLGWNEVLYVDTAREPVLYMDKVRVDGGANYLETNTGFTGQGVAGEALDSGVLASHQDFASNPPLIHGANNSDKWHGTMVAGVVFGDGTGNPTARGMMPDGTHVFSSFYSLGNRYTHTAQLLQPPYECVFQTNSWGYGYGVYTNETTTLDDVAFDYNIVICQAQGNSGNSASEVLSWAKNVLSVGGIIHQNTQTLADDYHNGSGGSTGPAPDNRFKPDMSYWYESIFTTYESGGYTSTFGGTSAATPETAGHVGLFHQMWHAGLFGNSTGSSAFDSRPKATTAKAFMINSADQYSFSGGSSDLRRIRQGWGRADLEELYDRRNKYLFIDENIVLTNLQSAIFDLEVAAGEPEFKATLVYLDPAGTTSSSQHRINDLSLRVTSPTGDSYWGNYQLKVSMYSAVGGNPNTKDTVENVWVQNPAAGTWRVEVLADEVNQDARVETPGTVDVDFALVVSGVSVACDDPVNYCTTSPNSVGSGAVMDWSGSTSFAANDLVLRCTSLPTGQFGLFFYGPLQTSIPVSDGTLCIGGTLTRLPVVSTSGSGDASWPLDLTNLPPMGPISVGDTVNFQFWYRDPGFGSAGNNFSDGLEATFCN